MSDLKLIKQIEKQIGNVLHERDFGSLEKLSPVNSFALNEKKQLIGLNLNSCKIIDISFLSQLTQLQKLSLFNNRIIDIIALQKLEKLTDLYLSSNQISDISVLKALSNLNQLDLSNNKISDISVLKALPNLIHLHLSSNQLSNISVLKALPNLTKLNLWQNKISDISVLKNLPNLTHLDLSSNKISDISVLKALPNLTHLELTSNQISDISGLKALPSLTELDLSDNKLSDISSLKELKKLTLLQLNTIQLKILPEWLLDFGLPITCGEYFVINGVSLKNNPIEEPPIEVIKQGNEAIRAYFEQLKKEGFDTIYEAKLILVGEGGAGKTSLANKIINPDYELVPEPESEPTQGIDIFSYSFLYRGKNFQVNIWDFAGQELKHQTHQFFLTKRSLYIFVVDSRRDNPNLYYWLKLVELLSGNSPLLIIKNEKKNCQCDIQESQLRAEFANIKDSFITNLSNNRGLTTIIENLQHYLGQLPHIGSPLPKTWVKVREQLEHDDRYYLDLKEYFALCQTNGFESEADKRQLSGYLHDLGVCLHFQEHELLDKTLILKPTWATDAVYKVLDNADVIKHSGRFSKDDLKQIWQAEQYSEMRSELLALMQKFKLCYEIPNRKNHYISPQLLEDKAPIMTGNPLRTASHGQDLLLRYQYDFMPKGIVSQFIVVMHEYIAHDYQWVWKSGVILEKNKTQAEIIEYYGKREIYIRVVGQNKKELLNIVSYELDKINSSYERLKDKCKKLIPCLCKTCESLENPHFYDYEKLKERIAHRKYTIECGNPPYADVDILKLIDDIDLPGFKNLEGLTTKQTIIQIDTGDKTVTTESRTIQTGVYVEGNVSGGNIAGRDINIQNNQGMNKDEFVQLLAQLKQELAQTNIEPKRLNSVTSDIAVIENEIAENTPDKDLIENKISGINLLLEKTNKVMDSADKGKETLMRVIATGKTLLSALSFLA